MLDQYGHGDMRVSEAIREYVRFKPEADKRQSLRVHKALDIYLETHLPTVGVRQQQTLRGRLGAFREEFGAWKLHEISLESLERWASGFEWSPRTRRNYWIDIRAFLNWCIKRGHLKTTNPITDLPQADSKPPQVLAPDDLQKLLDYAGANPPRQGAVDPFPAFCLGAFAGMRSSEIERLRWEAFSWDERATIEVVGKVKNKRTNSRRRLAPILPPLRDWLEEYAKGRTGRLFPPSVNHFNRPLARVAKAAGVELPENVLRDSWISCRMAILQNASQVAHEAGNSPEMIATKYDAVVSRKEGEAWFSILPTRLWRGTSIL
jgi:integrase